MPEIDREQIKQRMAKLRDEGRHRLTGTPLHEGMLTASELPPDYKVMVFLEEACDARENGFDYLCSECGAGMSGDGMDDHASGCSHENEDD